MTVKFTDKGEKMKNSQRLSALTCLIACGLFQQHAYSAPITVSLGDTLGVNFKFTDSFSATPEMLWSQFYPSSGEYNNGGNTATLYNGTSTLGTVSAGSAGPVWSIFTSTDSPFADGQVDFSSIRNQSINGRIETTLTRGPSLIYDPDLAGTTRVAAYRYIDIEPNSASYEKVGDALIQSITLNGDTIWSALQDFSSSIELLRPKDGVLPFCCGAFGLGTIGPNSNSATFELDFSGGIFTLGFDIGLYGDLPSSALMNTWERGIENAWSNKYELRDAFNAYPIVFDVNFQPGNRLTRTQDWVVEVHSETPDVKSEDNWWSTENWYWTLPLPDGADSACWGLDPMGRAAAHEFGHFLGLYDEYEGGNNGPFGVQTDGLMGGCIAKSVQDRYFQHILASINNLTSRDYVLGSLPGFAPSGSWVPPGPGFHDTLNTQIPEPSTSFLMTSGFILLAWISDRNRRRKRPN